MTLNLNAIKQRADAATEGPWLAQFWGGQNQNGDYAEPIVFFNDGEILTYLSASDEDVAFISHARTDIPDLIAEVERLSGVVDRVRDSVHTARHALHLTGTLDAREVLNHITTAMETE